MQKSFHERLRGLSTNIIKIACHDGLLSPQQCPRLELELFNAIIATLEDGQKTATDYPKVIYNAIMVFMTQSPELASDRFRAEQLKLILDKHLVNISEICKVSGQEAEATQVDPQEGFELVEQYATRVVDYAKEKYGLEGKFTELVDELRDKIKDAIIDQDAGHEAIAELLSTVAYDFLDEEEATLALEESDTVILSDNLYNMAKGIIPQGTPANEKFYFRTNFAEQLKGAKFEDDYIMLEPSDDEDEEDDDTPEFDTGSRYPDYDDGGAPGIAENPYIKMLSKLLADNLKNTSFGRIATQAQLNINAAVIAEEMPIYDTLAHFMKDGQGYLACYKALEQLQNNFDLDGELRTLLQDQYLRRSLAGTVQQAHDQWEMTNRPYEDYGRGHGR